MSSPTPPPPPPPPERTALSRELADFLIELSIALHKHAMYPEGHPSLAPAAAGVTRRAEQFLEERPTLSLGVARRQMVIEGVATDPKHPLLAELAGRLHRHHLGAVTFQRGIRGSEVTDVLRTLATEAERTGEPLGLGPPERLRAWEHIRLHSLTYERLELLDESDAPPADQATDGGSRARGAHGTKIPIEVLTKPGKLTDEERALMNGHPAAGARLLLDTEEDLDLAIVVAYEHHIMINGGGYPSLAYPRGCHHASRLVHVCDVYDALRTRRPYRDAWEFEKVLAYLNERAGLEFDSELAAAFTRMMRQWEPQVAVLSDEHAAVPIVAGT